MIIYLCRVYFWRTQCSCWVWHPSLKYDFPSGEYLLDGIRFTVYYVINLMFNVWLRTSSSRRGWIRRWNGGNGHCNKNIETKIIGSFYIFHNLAHDVPLVKFSIDVASIPRNRSCDCQCDPCYIFVFFRAKWPAANRWTVDIGRPNNW